MFKAIGDFAQDGQKQLRFNPKKNCLGASGEMAIITGNRDAELVLQRSSRFRIRFADNNLLRSTKFLQEKAANDRAGELTSSDKTKLIGLFAHL